VKIFGFWAAELAQTWDDDYLSRVNDIVNTVIQRLDDFVSSSHIEIQERVCTLFIIIQIYVLKLFEPWLIGRELSRALHFC